VPLRQKTNKMKNILNRLINHEMLTAAEAKGSWSISLMAVITQVKSLLFLTVFMMRSISIEELSGFRDALLELCIRVDLSDYNYLEQAVTERHLYFYSSFFSGAGVSC
jgi:anthranilate phosphoribosyltransferase